eukprot:571666-Pyramimonas_sp.AAC.1
MVPAGTGGEWERRPWAQAGRRRRWGGRIPDGGGTAAKWGDQWDDQYAMHNDGWKTAASAKGEIL